MIYKRCKCRVSFKERNPKEKFQSLKRRKALKMSTNKFMSFHLFRWRLEHLVLNNKNIKVCVWVSLIYCTSSAGLNIKPSFSWLSLRLQLSKTLKTNNKTKQKVKCNQNYTNTYWIAANLSIKYLWVHWSNILHTIVWEQRRCTVESACLSRFWPAAREPPWKLVKTYVASPPNVQIYLFYSFMVAPLTFDRKSNIKISYPFCSLHWKEFLSSYTKRLSWFVQ